jgi:hypothetical protein
VSVPYAGLATHTTRVETGNAPNLNTGRSALTSSAQLLVNRTGQRKQVGEHYWQERLPDFPELCEVFASAERLIRVTRMALQNCDAGDGKAAEPSPTHRKNSIANCPNYEGGTRPAD